MSRKHPGSRHHAQLNAKRWQRARRACFARDGYRCRDCQHAGRLEAHHITPLDAGGAPYALDNLATLCRACHIQRHAPESDPARDAWKNLVKELLTAPEKSHSL